MRRLGRGRWREGRTGGGKSGGPGYGGIRRVKSNYPKEEDLSRSLGSR